MDEFLLDETFCWDILDSYFIKDDLEDDVDFETPEGDLDPRQP